MVRLRSASSRAGFDLHPDQCRVVDVAVRARGVPGDVRIKTFALLAEGRMSPALPTELARLRQEQRLSRDAWVTVWGLRSVHQFLRLPPAATSELEALALREAHRDLSLLEDEAGRVSVALMVGPDVQVGSHHRREVSLTAVPQAEIARQIQPLVDAGFDVRGVCTPAMALTAIARHHERARPGTTAAYVALEANALCVAIVRDGVLLFSREIPWQLADSAEPVDQRLVAEIRRCFAFFRQSFRAVVERVVLCGGMPNLRALTAATGAALTLPVETLDSLSGIDAEALPEPADAFRASVAALWPAIAIASEGSEQPSLLSRSPRTHREMRRTLVRIAAVAIAGALVVAAWNVFGGAGRSDRAPELARLERRVAELEAEARRASSAPSSRATVPDVTPTPPEPEPAREPALVVGSILYSSQRRLAIVNGQIVRIGDRVGSSTILDIEPRAVIVVRADGTTRALDLRR